MGNYQWNLTRKREYHGIHGDLLGFNGIYWDMMINNLTCGFENGVHPYNGNGPMGTYGNIMINHGMEWFFLLFSRQTQSVNKSEIHIDV
jgi:hypothetical protein